MNIKISIAAALTAGLIAACAQIQSGAAVAPAQPLASAAESAHQALGNEEAKRQIVREGRYDLVVGTSGHSCERVCVVEPNAISCLQALEDEDCVTRAEDARKKLGLPQRAAMPLPMPSGSVSDSPG